MKLGRLVPMTVAAVGSALIVAVPVAPIAAAQPYKSCADAIADGAAPLFEGDPGYSEKLDANGDGVACINGSGATYFPPRS